MAVIAFIPVRGGSKSIPLKNIKNFCGRPLVYWTVKAAVDSACIDKVVVATDSPVIKEIVKNFELPKVEIYDRDEVNAQDVSSTESVMLEFLENSCIPENDVFILIQATSPLLTSADLQRGFKLYEEADSVLSAVRNKRFFWSDNGEPLNYDYRKRPRRQDFSGNFMENGAFYINSVENILRTKNRLSGKILICEMPEYTAFEIDEADDWEIMERLMRKHILSQRDSIKNIKLVLTDVDGVLSDSGMYYSEKGDELKKFNTHDGMGFKLLRQVRILTGIVTSEDTQIVARRAEKLKVDYLVQNAEARGGKLQVVKEICQELNLTLDNVAYIGDDINCKELLENVGVAACPADAISTVKNIPGIIKLSLAGGRGVFREFVNLILEGL